MKRRHLLMWTALAYALGIAAMAVSPILVGIFVAFCVTSFVLNRITKREQWAWIAVYCLIGIFGGLMFQYRSRIPANDISHLAPRLVTIEGTVASDIEGLENPQDQRLPKLKLTLNAEIVETEPGRTASVTGKIAIRLPVAAQNNQFPSYGDRVKVRGRLELPDPQRNPGGMDYKAYLAKQGIFSEMRVRRRDDWQLVESYNLSNPVTRFAYSLRNRLQSTPYNFLTPERAGTLNGIILGTHNDLPGRLRDDFQRTGTSHILSASGMNVAFVVVLSLWLFRLFRLTFRYACHFSIITVLLYTVMADSRPSIVRAAIMGIILLLAVIIEREPNYPNAIAIGALLLLLFDPQNLFDIGFQLSLAAIIALSLFLPSVVEIRKYIARIFTGKGFVWALTRRISFLIAESCVAVLAIQLGTLPLIAYHFSSFSLVGLIANCFVVPLVGVLMTLGFAGVVVGNFSILLAKPIYLLLNLLLSALIGTITFCAQLPYASVNAPLDWVGLCFWYTVIALIAWGWNSKSKPLPSIQEAEKW